MHASVTITPAQLPQLLLSVSVVRPVFLWGQPGIGKSSLVEQFAATVGLECVSLLGTQLAPEDIIGVPQIVDGRTRFCPPELIARDVPYVLFLDEMNGSSHEVQKAFYSLVLDRRIGNYRLPEGSVVIGAGNRSHDSAIVRSMSSALINRFVHLHLTPSADDWLAWAVPAGIDQRIVDYIRNRPDHLCVLAPKTEEPFSTPRSWHALSDVLASLGECDDATLRAVALGCVSASHAELFCSFVRTMRQRWNLDAILNGDMRWPADVQSRDSLLFLAASLRARLVRSLPASKEGAPPSATRLAHRAKALIGELADISIEIAQTVVVSGDDDGLPAWFLAELVRDLPRLAAKV